VYFDFLLKTLPEAYLILRRTERAMIINVYWSSSLVPDILVSELEFSLQILEKCTNIKFYENPSSGSRVVPCGMADRDTDMTKLIVAFRNVSQSPTM